MPAAKPGYIYLSREVGRNLIGFGANCLAGNLQAQLFPALFLIGDCYVQALLVPFEAPTTSRSSLWL